MIRNPVSSHISFSPMVSSNTYMLSTSTSSSLSQITPHFQYQIASSLLDISHPKTPLTSQNKTLFLPLSSHTPNALLFLCCSLFPSVIPRSETWPSSLSSSLSPPPSDQSPRSFNSKNISIFSTFLHLYWHCLYPGHHHFSPGFQPQVPTWSHCFRLDHFQYILYTPARGFFLRCKTGLGTPLLKLLMCASCFQNRI